VKYGDLNLNSDAGARVMLGRITSAASRACGEALDLHMLGRFALYTHCKAASIDQAVRALNAPLVTAMAGGKGPPATELAER
jgi:UrcA family protein